MVMESINPPLSHDYNKILSQYTRKTITHDDNINGSTNIQECYHDQELPLIDLVGLTCDNEVERVKCKTEIARASSEWGFFQVINHGISIELLNKMRREQIKLFNASFATKSTCGLLNNSYRWGTPTATSPENFSWSEAFHVPLTMIPDQDCYGEFDSLREVLVEYAAAMQKLAKLLAEVLVKNLGGKMEEFENMISEKTCFLRLNRYPSCPLSPKITGLVPHTDSDFLTILHQDQVGGLQLIKDSKWVAVKPNKDALIVNIGDLFQAWSNDLYKSVEHKVVANPEVERFSVAYFLCPSYDSFIGSYEKPSVYRNFTFGEYRKKIQEDAKLLGHKVGLSRFRQ
ncbi:hypothetical protein RD792_011345 [Penstemon davidsonii]|uniref:Fe2OG dioxygenase domain-containing protein n=1 Tax=Penstemon davidsonii TaxID=160366 RepID=A0ABR0D4B5_9LAMI|nr:hypothetical protein RD792_011345 [Penstemon davidsonii]